MAIPQKKCLHPSCRKLIPFTDSHCAKHNPHKTYDSERQKFGGDYVKFYKTAAWVKARQLALIRDDYLCQHCLKKGRYETATLVHHKIEIREDFDKRLDQDNLEGLCASCHQIHHRN